MCWFCSFYLHTKWGHSAWWSAYFTYQEHLSLCFPTWLFFFFIQYWCNPNTQTNVTSELDSTLTEKKKWYVQKNSPLTNKYQETLTSYNSETVALTMLHLMCQTSCSVQVFRRRGIGITNFLTACGNCVQDRLTHMANGAWDVWNRTIGLMFN